MRLPFDAFYMILYLGKFRRLLSYYELKYGLCRAFGPFALFCLNSFSGLN